MEEPEEEDTPTTGQTSKTTGTTTRTPTIKIQITKDGENGDDEAPPGPQEEDNSQSSNQASLNNDPDASTGHTSHP